MRAELQAFDQDRAFLLQIAKNCLDAFRAVGHAESTSYLVIAVAFPTLVDLANFYGGWDGRAEITFPQSGIGMRIEAAPLFEHLMLYCDPAKPFFCVEPQTHAAGAFNRINENEESNLGLIVLRPGESMEAEMSFICFSL